MSLVQDFPPLLDLYIYSDTVGGTDPQVQVVFVFVFFNKSNILFRNVPLDLSLLFHPRQQDYLGFTFVCPVVLENLKPPSWPLDLFHPFQV